MNEILQQCRRLPLEIDHLTKIDKNNEFKMAVAAILDFIYRS